MSDRKIFEAQGPLSGLSVRAGGTAALVFEVEGANESEAQVKTLTLDEVIGLRKALGEWLDTVYPEHEASSDEQKALPARTEVDAQLQRQGAMILRLQEALEALPAVLTEGVGRAIERGLERAAPALAEQAAAAAAALRPDGNSGYVDRSGAWRPPAAINYSDSPPGAGLMGAPPPPARRVERDPNSGRPIS